MTGRNIESRDHARLCRFLACTPDIYRLLMHRAVPKSQSFLFSSYRQKRNNNRLTDKQKSNKVLWVRGLCLIAVCLSVGCCSVPACNSRTKRSRWKSMKKFPVTRGTEACLLLSGEICAKVKELSRDFWL